ncbi:tonoplast intrinsic protein 2 [Rhynchospora pubera]|uniref:Tonoplast intrinsic protein 2 n=1 Tax=Rhynchospora pubera TaxID=906938 RepID=A0AAV8BWA6_9POAL|nr:tonoplast intrinsic protein 2 [Rhynchospora pubera]
MRAIRFAVGRREEACQLNTIRAAISELVATALYVFAAEGSTLALGKLYGSTSHASGLLLVALAHGFAYSAAVAVSSSLSSGYANPAITFGALLGGRISLIRALFYWSAQLLGSVGASLVLRITTGGMRPHGLSLALGVSGWNALLLEAVTSFGLMYAIYATSIDPRRGTGSAIAPVAAGFFVSANTIAGGPFDGAAMNPARVFGPALVGWRWGNHWVYWIGPFLGSGFAGLIYECLMIPQEFAPCTSSIVV